MIYIQKLFEYLFEPGWEIAQVYLLKIDTQINDMKLSKDEISEVKWLSFEKFRNLLYSSDFAPHNIDFRDKIIKIMESYLK